MRSPDSQDTGTVSAFLAGALLGTGITLLLAPQSGSQMRGSLRKYATRAQNGLNDVLELGADAYGTVIEGGQRYAEKGKKLLGDGRRQVRGPRRRAKNPIREK